MSVGLMLALFFVFMCLGMPIAYCMAFAAILVILLDGQLPVPAPIARQCQALLALRARL